MILDRKLSVHDHIDAIISKSMAMLGFLKRNSSEFADPYTLISLCFSYAIALRILCYLMEPCLQFSLAKN